MSPERLAVHVCAANKATAVRSIVAEARNLGHLRKAMNNISDNEIPISNCLIFHSLQFTQIDL